jgi:hypothetical protein
MRHLSIVLFLAMLALSVSVQAAPQRIHATYSLFKSGQEVAEVAESFVQEKGHYRIESITTAVGVFRILSRDTIKFISEGDILKTGLRPRHFEHHRGSREEKKIVADFDWSKREATFNYDGKIETAPISPGLQDRLSLMYQFMYLPLKTTSIAVEMSNGRSVSQYEYLRSGEELLTTKAGTFRTIRLSKKHTADEAGTEVWLAKDKFQFPVKVLIGEKKGGSMEQVLTKLSIR